METSITTNNYPNKYTREEYAEFGRMGGKLFWMRLTEAEKKAHRAKISEGVRAARKRAKKLNNMA